MISHTDGFNSWQTSLLKIIMEKLNTSLSDNTSVTPWVLVILWEKCYLWVYRILCL